VANPMASLSNRLKSAVWLRTSSARTRRRCLQGGWQATRFDEDWKLTKRRA